MSDIDTQKVGLGALLLFGGTALLFGGQFVADLPVVGIVAVLVLALGALFLGTSQKGRPV